MTLDRFYKLFKKLIMLKNYKKDMKFSIAWPNTRLNAKAMFFRMLITYEVVSDIDTTSG